MVSYAAFSDPDLALALKEGDQHAFAEIYRRYWHLLYLHAFKMLEDEDEAKDLVQEFFISLWAKAADLTVNSSLKAYLFMAVRHKVINQIRKRKTSDDFIAMIAEAMDEVDESTIQEISERELMAAIDAQINLLPPRMKQVFEMSRKEFLSNKEIALKLGTAEDTVKKQISNSIKILKDKLGKDIGVTLFLIEILKHR